MPEFSDALEVFMNIMKYMPFLRYRYTKKVTDNMRGLFYKYNDVLKEKRAKSIAKTKNIGKDIARKKVDKAKENIYIY